jgi:disulfide bond formation protein DsbB
VIPQPPRHVLRAVAVLLVLAPFGLAIACGPGAPEATPEQLAAGEKVFMTTCATCHGKNAEGLPKLGKNLHFNPYIRDKSDPELIAYVKRGRLAGDPENTTGVAMPPKGGNPALTDADVANVVSYLRTLDSKPTS